MSITLQYNKIEKTFFIVIGNMKGTKYVSISMNHLYLDHATY